MQAGARVLLRWSAFRPDLPSAAPAGNNCASEAGTHAASTTW